MKIRIGHKKLSEFEKELYIPIKNSILYKNNSFILPHDNEWKKHNAKEELKEIELFIAEVTYPATWLWIELWFAHLYNIPIICIYKKWTKIAWSLKYVSNIFIEYDSPEDMIKKLEKQIW